MIYPLGGKGIFDGGVFGESGLGHLLFKFLLLLSSKAEAVADLVSISVARFVSCTFVCNVMQ